MGRINVKGENSMIQSNTKMNESNCLDIQYLLLEGMYFDDKKETDDYILCTSKVVDDFFWNTAYLKNKINNDILRHIEDEFKNINRQTSLYIGRDNPHYKENKEQLLKDGYEVNDTDVYMVLDKKSDVEITTRIKVIENEKEYNDYMRVLASAYNDKIENANENVYADYITECYYNAVKNTMNSKDHIHIIAYDNDIPVSVATLSYVDGIGGINNVGTAQGYWNKGYGKQVIAYVIKKFEELGGGVLILCTEHNSKNQNFYEKLGFKEEYVMEQYWKNI